MNHDPHIALLYKELVNEIGAEDKLRLDRWLNASEENQKIAQEIRETWELSGKYKDPKVALDLDKEFAALEARIDAPSAKLRRFSTPVLWSMRVAAALAVLFLINYLLRPSDTAKEELKEFITQDRSDHHLLLKDGTKIWMNTHSSVKYPERFGETREIYLSGEAFLEVAHDPERPFIVHAEGAEIQVLGTSFQVRSVPNEDKTEIAVLSGKVQVRSTDIKEHVIFLEKEEIGIFNRKTKSLNKISGNTTNRIAWQSGSFEFDDSPLHEVFSSLETAYGVSIEWACEEIGEIRYSNANLPYEDAQVTLEIISLTNALSFEETEPRHFIISGKDCP